jgi:hypothetical protein
MICQYKQNVAVKGSILNTDNLTARLTNKDADFYSEMNHSEFITKTQKQLLHHVHKHGIPRAFPNPPHNTKSQRHHTPMILETKNAKFSVQLSLYKDSTSMHNKIICLKCDNFTRISQTCSNSIFYNRFFFPSNKT